MGACHNFFFSETEIETEPRKDPFKEINRETVSDDLFVIEFELEKEKNEKNMRIPIKLEVKHVETVDSTMPASRKYIDKGNILPFIYTTKIQTHGKGKGDRNWAGSIIGNIYTSSSIPTHMIKNELNANEVIVKITAISIIQQLRKFAKNEFFLKYPNDILCKDKKKLGGIIAEYYKDFCIIGFGINIVNMPEQNQIRKEGLSPCYVNAHLPKNGRKPNALDLSIDITKQIIYNLSLTRAKIDELFDTYINFNE